MTYIPRLTEDEQATALSLIAPLFQSNLPSYRTVACLGMVSLIRVHGIWPELRNMLLTGTKPEAMNPSIFELIATISEDMPGRMDACEPPILAELLNNMMQSMKQILSFNDQKYIAEDTILLTSIVRTMSVLIGICSPYASPLMTEFSTMLLVLCERLINHILRGINVSGSTMGTHNSQTEDLLGKCIRCLVTIVMQSAHSLVNSKSLVCQQSGNSPNNSNNNNNNSGRDLLNDVVDFIVAMVKLCLYGTIDVYNNYANVDISTVTSLDKSPYVYDSTTFSRIVKNPSPFGYSISLEVFEFFPAICDVDDTEVYNEYDEYGQYEEDFDNMDSDGNFGGSGKESYEGSIAYKYLRPYLFQLMQIFCDGIVYGTNDIVDIEDYFGQNGKNQDLAYAISATAEAYREGTRGTGRNKKGHVGSGNSGSLFGDEEDEDGFGNDKGFNVIEKWSIRKICSLSLEEILGKCGPCCEIVLADRLTKAMLWVRRLPANLLNSNDATLLIDSIAYAMAPLANVTLNYTGMVFNNICDIISLYTQNITPGPKIMLDKFVMLAISGACVCLPRINYTILFKEAEKTNSVPLLVNKISQLTAQLHQLLFYTDSKCMVMSISTAVCEIIKQITELVEEKMVPLQMGQNIITIIADNLQGLTRVLELLKNDVVYSLIEYTRKITYSIITLAEIIKENNSEVIAPFMVVGQPKRCLEYDLSKGITIYMPNIVRVLFKRIAILTGVFNSNILCFDDSILPNIFDTLDGILSSAGKETISEYINTESGISLLQLTLRIVKSILEEARLVDSVGSSVPPNYSLINTILNLWATFVDRASLYGMRVEEAIISFSNTTELLEILNICANSGRTEPMNGVCVFWGEVVKRDPESFLKLCNGECLKGILAIISHALNMYHQEILFCNATWLFGLLYRNILFGREDVLSSDYVRDIFTAIKNLFNNGIKGDIPRLNTLVLISRIANHDKRRALMIIKNDFGNIHKLCGGNPEKLVKMGDNSEKSDVFKGVYSIASQILEDNGGNPDKKAYLYSCRVELVRLLDAWSPLMEEGAKQEYKRLLSAFGETTSRMGL